MSRIDKRITKLRKELSALQRKKQMNKKPRVKSTRPQGRQPIPKETIALARELAKDYPIPDVALKLDVGLSTLYQYGIKRYLLNAEAANART